MPRLAFVDLETTGSNPLTDAITEVGIVTVDEDGSVEEWSQLLDPQQAIPPFIQQLTGITPAMVAGQPTFVELAPEIRQRLEGALFIAHNARFDYGFLKAAFRRLDWPFRATVLCTVKLSRRLYPTEFRHNLDAVIARHQLPTGGDRHRALTDARVLHAFWGHVYREHGAEHIQTAVEDLTRRSSLPPQLDPDLVDELPTGPGVYVFYGESGMPLYIGKSVNLRTRVLAHFNADHAQSKEMQLSQQVTRVEWHNSSGDLGASLLESRLVKELQPSYNWRLRKEMELCSWRWSGGEPVPQLVSASDVDFGASDDLYGLYRSAREANAQLRKLAAGRELCQKALGLEKGKVGNPCFAFQLRRCRGVCCGREPALQHAIRLAEALNTIKVLRWPYPGLIGIREHEARAAQPLIHLIERWCYLGSVRDMDELAAWQAQDRPQPLFDLDNYKLLVKTLKTLESSRLSLLE